MPATNPQKSSGFSQMTSTIQTADFDGHRVDVLVPDSLSPTTPLLLIHDGMNVFFEEYASSGDTWQIRELIAAKRIHGAPLVAAIWGEGGTQKYNPRRINEFLCDDFFAREPQQWQTLVPVLRPPTQEHRGNYFLDLVAEQIVPAIASSFGIEVSPRRTALVGCSVAGVASIYWMMKRPDVFGATISLSSHWEFGAEPLIDFLVDGLGAPTDRLIWSDSGTEGFDAVSLPLNGYFAERMRASGEWVTGINLETPTFWGADHHETAWARRVEHPINWWLQSLPPENES